MSDTATATVETATVIGTEKKRGRKPGTKNRKAKAAAKAKKYAKKDPALKLAEQITRGHDRWLKECSKAFYDGVKTVVANPSLPSLEHAVAEVVEAPVEDLVS